MLISLLAYVYGIGKPNEPVPPNPAAELSHFIGVLGKALQTVPVL